MSKRKNKKAVIAVLINLCYPLASVSILVAVYAVAAAAANENLILPNWGEIFSAATNLLSQVSFYKSLLMTLLRSAAAFAAAFLIGGALGVGAKYCEPLRRLFTPLMTLLRAVPTMAVIFLLVLWVRSAYSPAIVSFTILMPLSYTQMYNALSSLDDGIFEMSKVYRVPKSRILTKFVLPQIAPQLIEATAGNLSFSVKLVIAGEALAQTASSLGGMINNANVYLETARLMAVTLLAVAVCFILEGAVKLLLLSCRRWQ